MTPTPHSGSCFLSPLNDLQDAQVAVKVVQGTLGPLSPTPTWPRCKTLPFVNTDL